MGLGISNSPPTSDVGIDLARFGQGHLFLGIGDFVHDGAHRIHVDLAGFGIELGAQIFVGLVILPRGHHHRVLDGRDDDLPVRCAFPG